MTTTFIRGENPLRADKLNTAFGEKLDKAGDTMTGALVLPGSPTTALQAATKQYVDESIPESTGGSATSGRFVTGYSATILTDDRTGLLIPGYVYPNNPYSDAAFLNLLDIMRRYHDVPVIYVINPGSGPGTVLDGNYAAAIRVLRGAGAAVIGYVSTVYAGRDPALVRADVDTWVSMYADTPVDGIFFDEMPWDLGTGNSNITLYQSYCSYVHGKGLQIVVGNPGTVEQGKWYLADPPTADIIVTWENSAYPNEGDLYLNFSPDGHVDYTWKRNSVMVYGQQFNAAKFTMMRKHVKWLWATDDVLPNPYDTFPPYMEALFAACRVNPYARMQIEWPNNSSIVNGTLYFVYDAPRAGTINSLTHFCNTGGFVVAVRIDGVNVTGLGAVAPGAVPGTTQATALNKFVAGQKVMAVIAGVTLPTSDGLLSLDVTWN